MYIFHVIFEVGQNYSPTQLRSPPPPRAPSVFPLRGNRLGLRPKPQQNFDMCNTQLRRGAACCARYLYWQLMLHYANLEFYLNHNPVTLYSHIGEAIARPVALAQPPQAPGRAGLPKNRRFLGKEEHMPEKVKPCRTGMASGKDIVRRGASPQTPTKF